MILVHPLIDPVIISFGFIQIRWYSMAYVLGFFIGLYLIIKINKKFTTSLSKKKIDDFLLWSILGVILGGRIGYFIFYQTSSIFTDPLSILFIWQGGMSFHGGLIGIFISIYIYSKKNNINFLYLSDLVSAVAPIGIFFGRIANFINIELYGRVTDFYFAMIYTTIDNNPRHPSQIYEAFFEGLILLIILFFSTLYSIKNKKIGINSSLFLFFYGIFRFFIEFLREPDPHLGLFFDYITMGQLLCIPLIIIGIFIFLKKYNE